MSVEEYLHTSFDGADREYLDGEVVERNMGNKSHSKLQGRFIYLFYPLQASHGCFVAPELRHKVKSTRYRIPDIALFEREPDVEVPAEAPLVAVEVLSPDDRPSYLLTKLAEYRNWGVKHIWIADPDAGKLFTYGENGLREVAQFDLPEYGFSLTSQELFA